MFSTTRSNLLIFSYVHLTNEYEYEYKDKVSVDGAAKLGLTLVFKVFVASDVTSGI